MTAVLKTSGGSTLKIGATGLANKVSIATPGSKVFTGNGGTYYSGLYQAYCGMWSTGAVNNTNMTYTVDTAVQTSTFPNNTVFETSIIPDRRWGGVEGFLALSYGNYDENSITGFTPKKLQNITALSLNLNWTFTGNNRSGLLCECYVTTNSHATGGVSGGADVLAEIAFFPHNGPTSKQFAAGLPSVGSFTDSNGISWNVGRSVSGVQAAPPYYVATRPGQVDYVGPLDFKSYFNFLVTAGKLTGAEYFNGLGFGYEPFSDSVEQLTITNFVPTYS